MGSEWIPHNHGHLHLPHLQKLYGLLGFLEVKKKGVIDGCGPAHVGKEMRADGAQILIGPKSILGTWTDFASGFHLSHLAPYISLLSILLRFLLNSLTDSSSSSSAHEQLHRNLSCRDMAAATSGAVINGLGSAFLCGSKTSQRLLSGVGARTAGGSAAPRRMVVVAAQPKKSWIPAVKGGGNFINPEWLDGSWVSWTPATSSTPINLSSDTRCRKWFLSC